MAEIIDFQKFAKIERPPVDPEVHAIMQAMVDYTFRRVFERHVIFGEPWEVAQAEVMRQIVEEK